MTHRNTAQGVQEMKVIQGGQMSLIRDTEEILKFLEFAARKSIMNEHAINCRLTACHNLFSVLNEDEDSIDYILKNLDVLINRFRNKSQNVRASTLKVYKSRVKSSLEDFKAWSADPFAWERAVTDKAKASGLESRKEKLEKQPAAQQMRKPPPPAPAVKLQADADLNADAKMRKVSFPVRPGLVVEMTLPEQGITQKELHRLGLFLYPYCTDIDVEHSPWAGLKH